MREKDTGSPAMFFNWMDSPESSAFMCSNSAFSSADSVDSCGISRLVCCGCETSISDLHLLTVREFDDKSWHERCLRCCVCGTTLDTATKCFYRRRGIYCERDYLQHRLRVERCSKCERPFDPLDWVRQAKDRLYHLACFACDACKRELSTGELFARVRTKRLLCERHYGEIAISETTSDNEFDLEIAADQRHKRKRMRTSFSEKQLRLLHASFQADSSPDGQDLERIAAQTGLSKRVTQVWFQNSRARMKRHYQMTSSTANPC